MSKITNDDLTLSGIAGMFYSCTHMALVGVKGFNPLSSVLLSTVPSRTYEYVHTSVRCVVRRTLTVLGCS